MGGKLILILVIQVTQYKKLFSMETGIPLFLNILMCSQPGQVSVIIRISVILWLYFPRKQLHNDPVKRNIPRASFVISIY